MSAAAPPPVRDFMVDRWAGPADPSDVLTARTDGDPNDAWSPRGVTIDFAGKSAPPYPQVAFKIDGGAAFANGTALLSFAGEHEALLWEGQLLQLPPDDSVSVTVSLDALGHVELWGQNSITPPLSWSNVLVQAVLVKDEQVLVSNRLSMLVEY